MNWESLNKPLNIILALLILGYIANYIYRLPKFDSGQKAKDFEATLIDGKAFKLSDLQGRYILLDFWGSWCGPCRRENPELVNLYQETKGKIYTSAAGFDIVSIAIETNEVSWKKAIKSDRMDWNFHIGQMDRFSSPIATLYGVKEIPTKYFISPDGMILMVNPSTTEIKNYLEEREGK